MLSRRVAIFQLIADVCLTSVDPFGITGGARKKESHMRWMDDIKSVTGLSVNDNSVSERQEKVDIISEKHSQEEKTDCYLIQGEGNGKLLLWEWCLVHPQGSPGVLQTRRTSSSYLFSSVNKELKYKFHTPAGSTSTRNLHLQSSQTGVSYSYQYIRILIWATLINSLCFNNSRK